MADFRTETVPASAAALPWRPWTVALLLLACFIPRAVAAWHWDVLWGDTLHYLYASRALERGDFDRGFAELGLNIYPLMLIPLRHLGVDWQIAAKWFSVLVATFTVVPLWAWLRRMFDDRTALLACLVYAFHGKLIAISPLIIRDATFWLLLATALYCLWRAVSEMRLAYFLAAGAALTLAVHTRTEGWLLLVPLIGWTARSWIGWIPSRRFKTVEMTMPRLRLAAGMLLCMAVIPASVAAVNATWLREHPQWGMLRARHLQIALAWWKTPAGQQVVIPDSESTLGPELLPDEAAAPETEETPAVANAVSPPATVAESNPPQSSPASISLPPSVPTEKSASRGLLVFKLLERLAKGCTWVGIILLLLGIGYRWRIFLRPEHLTLLAMNLLLLIVAGIRYRTAGLDLRYFMPIVIVGLPWMGLGAQFLVNGLLKLMLGGSELARPLKPLVAGGGVAILVLCSLFDAPLSAAGRMRKHAAIGRWIHEHAASKPLLAGNVDYLTLDTFYAGGKTIGLVWPRDCLVVPLPRVLTEHKADFVVLWNYEDLRHEHLAMVERRISDNGNYRRIPPHDLPAGEDEVLVFAKTGSSFK